MDNYDNLWIIMHTGDIVLFRSMCLIMKRTCVKFHYDIKTISKEIWGKRDRRTDGFEDRSIKFFPIFIWILKWSISIPPSFDECFV